MLLKKTNGVVVAVLPASGGAAPKRRETRSEAARRGSLTKRRFGGIMTGNRSRVGERLSSTPAQPLKTLNLGATGENVETGATVKGVENVKNGAVLRLGIEKNQRKQRKIE